MATPTYDPIASTTLSSSASIVTFSSIPSDYRDLIIVADKVRAVLSGRTFFMRINGSTSGIYNLVYMLGNGSTASSAATSGDTRHRLYPFSHPAVPGQEPTYRIQLMDYSVTDKHKSGLVRTDNWDAATIAYATRWADTSAITSVSFAMDSGDIAAGATFALYGVSA